MNSHHEVVIGDKTDAVARFYGVHFEHKIDSQQQEPMIVCGLKDKPSSTQAVFDHCQFFGNGTNRAAIKFLGVDTCQVISSRFESFKTDGELIQTFDGVSKHITVADSLIIP
jgi:hypothetical protein